MNTMVNQEGTKETKRTIEEVLLTERVQSLVYDKSPFSLSITGVETKELSELLVNVYVGALRDYMRYPESSEMILNSQTNDSVVLDMSCGSSQH